jgi:phage shock protein A
VRAVADKSSIDKQLQRLEDENMFLQQQVQELQKQLAETEHQHAQRYNLDLDFFVVLFAVVCW